MKARLVCMLMSLAVLFSLVGCPGAGGVLAGTGKLEVQNGTATSTVRSLFYMPSGGAAWSSNVLGSSTIAPGGSWTVAGLAPGSYSFHASEDPAPSSLPMTMFPRVAAYTHWTATRTIEAEATTTWTLVTAF